VTVSCLIGDCVVAYTESSVSARTPRATRADVKRTRRRRSTTRDSRIAASQTPPQSRTQTHETRAEVTSAAAVHEEVDGEVEEVKQLKQLLPRELAAGALDAGADEVVEDGLDSEHVRRKVEQDGEAAQYQQHAGCTELRVSAGESCGRVMRLDQAQTAVTL